MTRKFINNIEIKEKNIEIIENIDFHYNIIL